jgi:ribosome biogenesis GTPase / thiamine phosphate phosphatase
MTNAGVPSEDLPHTATDGAPTAHQVEGLVVALAPGLFEVAIGDGRYLCTLRGKLRKPRPLPTTPSSSRRLGNQPQRGAVQAPEEPPPKPVRIAPGDRVRVTRLGPGEGVIEDVLPRRTALSRMRGEVGTEQIMFANPDQAVLVFSVQQPEPHFRLLDRYLALCEHAEVPAVVCFNKVDLGTPGAVQEAIRLYQLLGYPVLLTSAATGEGMQSLHERLSERLSLLTGPSGVGKSSLMNVLLPDARQRTGEISSATGKGRHTTTGVRLLPLPEGGWLADSAGIRELALWNVPPDELPQCFVELRPFVGECLYEDCQHTADEEGCALRAALADGHITPRRWISFERLLEEARAEEKPAWERDA